jgi:hypothetical protein
MRDKVLCKDCKFVDSVSDPNNIGYLTYYCHLNPPTPIMGPAMRGQTVLAGIYAPVAPDGWCKSGERELVMQ